MMLPPTVVHGTINVTPDLLSNGWADMLLLRCHSTPCYTMLVLILFYFLLFTLILGSTATVPALCSGYWRVYVVVHYCTLLSSLDESPVDGLDVFPARFDFDPGPLLTLLHVTLRVMVVRFRN